LAVLGIRSRTSRGWTLAGALSTPSGYYIGGDSWLDYASHGFVYLFANTKFITILVIGMPDAQRECRLVAESGHSKGPP
jgi:hypothetical protein